MYFRAEGSPMRHVITAYSGEGTKFWLYTFRQGDSLPIQFNARSEDAVSVLLRALDSGGYPLVTEPIIRMYLE